VLRGERPAGVGAHAAVQRGDPDWRSSSTRMTRPGTVKACWEEDDYIYILYIYIYKIYIINKMYIIYNIYIKYIYTHYIIYKYI